MRISGIYARQDPYQGCIKISASNGQRSPRDHQAWSRVGGGPQAVAQHALASCCTRLYLLQSQRHRKPVSTWICAKPTRVGMERENVPVADQWLVMTTCTGRWHQQALLRLICCPLGLSLPQVNFPGFLALALASFTLDSMRTPV